MNLAIIQLQVRLLSTFASMKNIAIFASGSGSNALRILEHFSASNVAQVVLIVASKPNAGVLKHAENFGVESLVLEKDTYADGSFLRELKSRSIDFIALAGFLWKVADYLLNAYANQIVNIHPSLLPKHGGKGMYGMWVHRSVIDSGDEKSGITIHYVNGNYDEGAIIFQAECEVLPNDTAETLAARVLKLEHEHFPIIIEKVLCNEL